MEGVTPPFMSDSKRSRMGLEGRWWREDIAVKYLEKKKFFFFFKIFLLLSTSEAPPFPFPPSREEYA